MFGIGRSIKAGIRAFKEYHEKKKIIKNYIKIFVEQQKIQDSYELSGIKNAKKIVVFIIPPENCVYGGMMSFFSLCSNSRKVLDGKAEVLLATCMCKYYDTVVTYAYNDKFPNDEKIYRFEQIAKYAENVSELIIHLPEIYISNFLNWSTNEELNFIKKVKHLQINILLQNIDLMPDINEIKRLFKFTKNITVTTAHQRYATQQISNMLNAPLKHISVDLDISKYKKIKFENKEKIIVFSPDNHKDKIVVQRFIETYLPKYRIITVENMKFDEYMELITKAMFVITFGEAFDGYFIQPYGVGTLGLSVYNDRFFPDKTFKQMKTVYSSYLDLAVNIEKDIRFWENHKNEYIKYAEEMKNKFDNLYRKTDVEENLIKFYNNEYDFLPCNNGENL